MVGSRTDPFCSPAIETAAEFDPLPDAPARFPVFDRESSNPVSLAWCAVQPIKIAVNGSQTWFCMRAPKDAIKVEIFSRLGR